MVSVFRERGVAGFFAVVILSIVLHSSFFFHPPQVLIFEKSGLLSFLLKYLQAASPVVLAVIYHLLILMQALWLNYILNETRMFQKQAYTGAMVYVMLTALFPQWANISPALITNVLAIWVWYKMMQLYGSTNSKILIYNIGFISVTTTILYLPAFVLIPVTILSLAILRSFRLREWFVLLLGLLTPCYFLLSILYLNNDIGNAQKYLQNWQLYFKYPERLTSSIISIGIVVLLVLAGLYQWKLNSNRSLIQTRKMWSLTLLILFCFSVIPFVCYNPGYRAGLLCIIPVSAFIALVFVDPPKKWLSAIFFWTLTIMILYNNWAFLNLI